MTFKCQEKNMCKKVHNFHHYTTWFLAPLIVLHSLAQIYSHNQTQNILLWSCVEKDLTHYVYIVCLVVGINLNGGQIMHIQILGPTCTIKICSCTHVC